MTKGFFNLQRIIRVLQEHGQLAILSLFSTLQCQLHVVITLVLFRWLVVSVNQEMALMSWELLNNADFYFCFVIMLVMLSSKCVNKNAIALHRCTRARLSVTIN